MEWLKWLLLIVVVIVLIVLLRLFKKPRIETFNLVSGAVGGGKTSSVICRVKSQLRKYYFIWRNRSIKNDYIILSNFPIGKLKKDRKGNPLYRYMRIWFKKIKCYDLDMDILTMQKRLPQDEVILIIDEFSQIASQFDFNNPIVSRNMNELFAFFRHYTNGKGYIYGIDQCSENIFLQLRRRASYCYNMLSCRKILLLPITIFEYRKIMISDEVQNIIEVKDGTDENELRKFIFFVNPFKWYNTHAYYYRYKKVPITFKLKYNDKDLYRNDLMKLTTNKPLYYNCLSYDGLNESDYLKLFIKESNKDKMKSINEIIIKENIKE